MTEILRGFAKVETSLPPCHPGEVEWVRAEAELTDDISPVFPYLSAIMKGPVYDPQNQTLMFTLGGHGVTLYPRRVHVTKLQDEQEAREFLEHLRRLINEIWGRREEITLSYKTRAKLTALTIYAHVHGVCLETSGRRKKTPPLRAAFRGSPPRRKEEKLIRLLADAGYEI